MGLGFRLTESGIRPGCSAAAGHGTRIDACLPNIDIPWKKDPTRTSLPAYGRPRSGLIIVRFPAAKYPERTFGTGPMTTTGALICPVVQI
jgi:hypothetical protein